MADALGTVTTVLHIVKEAYELYCKIKDCPPLMERIGEHLELVQLDLERIQAFLKATPVSKQGTRVLLCLIQRIREDSEDVTAVFHKWSESNKPAKVWFVVSGKQDDLIALRDAIDTNRAELSREMLYMGGPFGVDKFGVLPAQPSLHPTTTTTITTQASNGQQQAEAPRRDYSIIFVDPYDTARSVVAEAYMKLLQGWTTGTGGDWRFTIMHSAGFFVTSRSGVVDLVQNMEYTYPSYKLPMAEGHKPPNTTAMDALFGNEMFKYPFKQTVKRDIEARRSRGIHKTMFKHYDFVIAFTNREYDNLMRLRRALIAQEGRHAVTRGGKGRIIHLGTYVNGAQKGRPREILTPIGDGTREEWNARVGLIKTAVKGFLKQEVGWKQPDKGAKVSS